MHVYGTTRRQLAALPSRPGNGRSATRRLRPGSPERGGRAGEPDDLRPMSLLDCCLVTDGAGAVVLVRAERAADQRQSPVDLLGCASAQTHRQISQMPT